MTLRLPSAGVSLLALLAAAVAPAPASALVHCTPAASWGTVDRDDAREVLRLVNEHRAGLGLAPLALDGDLQRAAEWKSLHMARYGYFDHDDPAPPVARGPFQRFADCGYDDGGARAENIAAGQTTPAGAVGTWLASPPHRASIENAALRTIGIGVARRDGSPYGVYWTQTFGSRQDAVPLYPPPAEPPDLPPPANRAPLARPDRAAVRRGRLIAIRVLRNDADPDGDRLRLAGIAGTVRHGSARARAGRLRYEAPRRFTGTVVVRYRIVDGRGGRAIGTVRIRVR